MFMCVDTRVDTVWGLENNFRVRPQDTIHCL